MLVPRQVESDSQSLLYSNSFHELLIMEVKTITKQRKCIFFKKSLSLFIATDQSHLCNTEEPKWNLKKRQERWIPLVFLFLCRSASALQALCLKSFMHLSESTRASPQGSRTACHSSGNLLPAWLEVQHYQIVFLCLAGTQHGFNTWERWDRDRRGWVWGS